MHSAADELSPQVNPQAIRSTVEVYCANVRTIVELHTEHFGRVLYVCIGAMLVGSSIQTVKTGDKIKRGDEVSQRIRKAIQALVPAHILRFVS